MYVDVMVEVVPKGWWNIYIYIRNMKPYDWGKMKTVQGLPQAAPNKSIQLPAIHATGNMYVHTLIMLENCRQPVRLFHPS